MPISIRIKRGVGGAPTTLLRGELAFDEDNQKLYIGKGDSGSGDANGLPIATSVVELTTPPSVLADLADISVGSGASDGDVLVYDGNTGDWVAEALAIAWDNVASKPATFTPSTHASSHHTGGGDAIAPADIGAAAATHSHAWGDITSGVPSDFTPSSHTHGNISDDGKIGSTAGLVVQTGASGAVTTLAAGTSGQVLKQGSSGLEWGTAGGVGTVTSVTAGTGLTGGTFTDSGTIAVDFASTETAGKVVEANDTRLSDTRTPTDNTVATAKIQDGAVTYAKIQDVSATDKILGRATAGAGDVEEITCTAAGRALLDDADAAAQRTTLGLGGAAEKAVNFYAEASHAHGNITNAGAIGSTSGLPVKTGTSGVLEAGAFGTSAGEFAEGNHTHAWTDITSKPSDFTPSAHNHTVTLEISGFIEAPEAKTYILSPSIPTAITVINVKAKTSSGTCDIKLQDDGVDISDTSINDVSTSVSSPASQPSATVASGSVLALVVSDLSSGAPEDLAFSVHYTVASANNA